MDWKMKTAGMGIVIALSLCGCSGGSAVPPQESVVTASSAASASAAAEASPAPVSESMPDAADNSAFFAQTKEYILNGQEDVPESGRLLWSERFLDALDMDSVYAAYLSAGGAASDAPAFAAYLTENAAAPENWKELFEQDLASAYEQTPAEYRDLGDGIYQVMIDNNGTSVPFVTVNSRTGWYHG